MRNTYRPVLLRASVRRDPAGGYRNRRRPLYFYARMLKRSVTSLASLRIRRERRTSVMSQLMFLAVRHSLAVAPPLSVSFSPCLRDPEFRLKERAMEFGASGVSSEDSKISPREQRSICRIGNKRNKSEGKRKV